MALRDMREERPFLLEVSKKTADLPSEAVVFVGSAKHAAALLFYSRMKSAVKLIEVGDYAGFSQLIERRRGGHVAVILRSRGQELDFLRRCAEENDLQLDVSKPDIMEKCPPFGDRDRRSAFFLIRAPENMPSKDKKQPSRGNDHV